jgi:hypothetical protein
MSRPTYEREDHLAAERRVIDSIEALHGVKLSKTPKYYHIDYCIVDIRNKVCGWVEIRNKNFERAKFTSFYTSLEKYLSVAKMGHLTGMPAYIACEWTDGTFFKQVSHGDARKYPITIGGRTVSTRNDPDDIEPVIHIPITEFQPITDMFQ